MDRRRRPRALAAAGEQSLEADQPEEGINAVVNSM